jgi:hypothetical protein
MACNGPAINPSTENDDPSYSKTDRIPLRNTIGFGNDLQSESKFRCNDLEQSILDPSPYS